MRRLSKESLLPLIANLIRVGAAPAAGLLLGLLLSAFFWLPALSEGGLVNQDQWYGGYYKPELHFVYPHQLACAGLGLRHQPARTGRRAAGCLELPDRRRAAGAGRSVLDRPARPAFGAASRADAAVGCGCCWRFFSCCPSPDGPGSTSASSASPSSPGAG